MSPTINYISVCLTRLYAWLTLLNPPEPLIKPQTVDPLAHWFSELSQTPLASSTLSMSETLVTQARLLPFDYAAETLMLDDGTLTLNINQTVDAPNRHTLNIWRQKITPPAPPWDSTLNQLRWPAPLAPQDMPISVLGQYPAKLYEQLRLLGADKLSLTENAQIGQVEDWRLTGHFSGKLSAHLGNMAYLTANKPVFMRELKVTPHDKGESELTFTFTLLGVK